MMTAVGVLLCLLSAAGFGAMAIFGKLAFEEGVTVSVLLAVRFALAAAMLVPVAAAARVPWPRGRALATALALGCVGYALQAGLYFAALERMDASVLAVLLYTYPAFVTVAAVALRRERATAYRFAVLGTASAGTVLVLLGAGTGALNGLGVALGLGAALTYTGYILVAERLDVDPLPLSALVTVGAAVSLGAFALLNGPEGFEAMGWLWLACIATVSTVLPVLSFFGGLNRVGASTAAILSTAEPVITVALAAAVFSEVLTETQLLGAGLVLAAVIALQQPLRRWRPARRAVPSET